MTSTCTASARTCGTPAGWRKGGRCPQCRRAHNEDTNERRRIGTLSESDRAAVLETLRRGRGIEEAAAAIGRSAKSVQRQALTDSELRLAMDGAPAPVQRVARLGDYLAALTRHDGVVAHACRETGVSDSGLHYWRSTYPVFAAAETAVLAMVRDPDLHLGSSKVTPAMLDTAAQALEDGATKQQAAALIGLTRGGLKYLLNRSERLERAYGTAPRKVISDAALEKAAEALEQGATIKDATALIGFSASVLRYNAHRSERLQEALPPPNRQAGDGRGRKPDMEGRERLRRVWSDPSLTVAEKAKIAGVSVGSVYRWAGEMGLPLGAAGRKEE